ncbi:MAG: Gx transporter family protein [Clostridia bacterium]|nr:Gx transporter family protein [Clostridia bacterium]
MKNKRVFKLALAGLFASLATITFTLESLFPPIIIPGARMGLSNVFILLTALTLGYGYGVAVLAVKTLLGSLFSGNISALMYSLPSGLIALTVQILLFYNIKKVSLLAVSVLGAVVNIVLQNIVFCLITKTIEYLAYSPYLALIGVISGVIVGLCVYTVIKKSPQSLTLYNKGEKN